MEPMHVAELLLLTVNIDSHLTQDFRYYYYSSGCKNSYYLYNSRNFCLLVRVFFGEYVGETNTTINQHKTKIQNGEAGLHSSCKAQRHAQCSQCKAHLLLTLQRCAALCVCGAGFIAPHGRAAGPLQPCPEKPHFLHEAPEASCGAATTGPRVVLPAALQLGGLAGKGRR